jgi:hypothetical protein
VAQALLPVLSDLENEGTDRSVCATLSRPVLKIVNPVIIVIGNRGEAGGTPSRAQPEQRKAAGKILDGGLERRKKLKGTRYASPQVFGEELLFLFALLLGLFLGCHVSILPFHFHGSAV